MQWSSRPKFHISRSKIISSKDTDGKETFHRMLSFLLVDKKGFFYKKKMYSRKLCFEKEINVTSKYIAFLRHFKHLEISFSARLEICVGFCHLILLLIN